MDFPNVIIWMSPLSFLGASVTIFHFYYILDEFPLSKQNSLRWDATFAASHLGLFCLPMYHKKEARLIWVKNSRNKDHANISESTVYENTFDFSICSKHCFDTIGS